MTFMRAAVAVAPSDSTDELTAAFHWFVLIAVLVLVVAPTLWLSATVLATRALRRWPSLVAANENAFYRWVLLIGVVPVVGPLVYASVHQQAKWRRTPEQLLLAQVTHRERQRRQELDDPARWGPANTVAPWDLSGPTIR